MLVGVSVWLIIYASLHHIYLLLLHLIFAITQNQLVKPEMFLGLSTWLYVLQLIQWVIRVSDADPVSTLHLEAAELMTEMS